MPPTNQRIGTVEAEHVRSRWVALDEEDVARRSRGVLRGVSRHAWEDRDRERVGDARCLANRLQEEPTVGALFRDAVAVRLEMVEPAELADGRREKAEKARRVGRWLLPEHAHRRDS